MTTQTRVLPELDEALDFDPTCCVGHHDRSDYDPCNRPADWLTVRQCCGRASLLCEPHKDEYLAKGWRICAYCRTSPFEYSRIERIR